MIQLIASDMDGTLLNNAGYITPYTADVIQKLQNSGIRFIVNTGREYQSAKKELDAASISCDIICCSGAASYDSFGNPFHIHPIPKSTAKKILEIFQKHHAFADICTNYGKSSVEPISILLEYYQKEVFPSIALEQKSYFKDSADFEQTISHIHYYEDAESLLNSASSIYKISTTFVNPEKTRLLRQEIETLPGLHIASASSSNLEITDEKAQKGFALLQYADLHSIHSSEILAIGDSENDISMLSLNLGQTVAMGNASPAVKKVCSASTLSNDDDGAAVLLEGLLMERYFYEMHLKTSHCVPVSICDNM